MMNNELELRKEFEIWYLNNENQGLNDIADWWIEKMIPKEKILSFLKKDLILGRGGDFGRGYKIGYEKCQKDLKDLI